MTLDSPAMGLWERWGEGTKQDWYRAVVVQDAADVPSLLVDIIDRFMSIRIYHLCYTFLHLRNSAVNATCIPSHLEVCTAFCQAGYTISGNATVLICGEGPDSSNGYTEFMTGTEDPGLYYLTASSFKRIAAEIFSPFLLALS